MYEVVHRIEIAIELGEPRELVLEVQLDLLVQDHEHAEIGQLGVAGGGRRDPFSSAATAAS